MQVNLTDTELAQVAVADGSDHVPIVRLLVECLYVAALMNLRVNG